MWRRSSRCLPPCRRLATWDDHDFGLNNADRTYSARTDSLRVFRNYWANPASGLPETPGRLLPLRVRGRGSFHARRPLLSRPEYVDPMVPARRCSDPRSWRGSRRDCCASRCALQAAGVAAAAGRWPMGRRATPGAAFRGERNRLFDFIRDQRIEGVVLLSGRRAHRRSSTASAGLNAVATTFTTS